ncbi:MAG TPA: hypothetical protein VHW24_26895 [Bryobacteraceae bacterium]|nr:hypothetical protein [Bryobacteraceae bacterium]
MKCELNDETIMVAGILIIAFSTALLVYWFRYSCILIIRNQAELAPEPVADARFTFSKVRESLNSETELDPLRAELDRDYRVLTYLIEHAAGLDLATLEDRILVWDYRIMQCVYSVTHTLAPEQARNALLEMSTILGILAQRLGERAGTPSEV